MYCFYLQQLLYTAKDDKPSDETKIYAVKYLKEVFSLPSAKNQHIYLLQSIRCSSCAEHSFDYIVKNENNAIQKIFIITSTLRQDYLDKIRSMPNTSILIDTNQMYSKYGILYSKDLFINVKIDSITDLLFINPNKLNALKPFFK